jgi:hypothetical protein
MASQMSSNTSRLSNLPTEILLEMIYHLDWTNHSICERGALKRQRPLKELSCVNQRFRAILLVPLFESIQARHYRRRLLWHPKGHILDYTCFTSRPDLCALVRKVTYDSVVRAEWMTVFDITVGLLRRFTNLRVLRMTLDFDDGAERLVHSNLSGEGLVSKLPNVEDIHVSCHMLALLGMCPNAYKLRIDCTHESGKEPIHALVSSPRITHLYFQVREPEYELRTIAAAYPNLEAIVFSDEHPDSTAVTPISVTILSDLLPRLSRVEEWWKFERNVVQIHADRMSRWDGMAGEERRVDHGDGYDHLLADFAIPSGWGQRMVERAYGAVFGRVVANREEAGVKGSAGE